MKFIFILAFTLLQIQSSVAQVTIAGNQYTHANSSNTYEDALPTWAGAQTLIETSGPDQTWVISDWQSISSNTEIFEPISALGAVYGLFFNNNFLYPEHVSTHALATIGMDMGIELPLEVTNAYAIFRNSDTGYYNTGNGFYLEGLPIITRNTVVEQVYPWPLEYELEFSGAGEYLTTIPTLGAYGQSSSRNGFVDSWGTIEGPFGSFSVLRIRTEIAITDTIFFEQFGSGQLIERPLQIDYSWISPEREGPILTISTVENQIVSIRLLNEGINLSASERFLETELVKAFPNPSNGEVSFSWNDALPMNLQLMDMNGRDIWKGKVHPGEFNALNLSAGIYLAQFSRDDQYVGMLKLVITE